MATRNDIDQRLRRLERLSLLSFLERNGLSPGMSAIPQAGSIRGLRALCAHDAAAIARELDEPVMESRAL
jgi:hypothetical protein